MRASILVALVLAVGVAGWILSGQLSGSAVTEADPVAAAPAETPAAPARVRVARLAAEPYMLTVAARGRTAASRRVSVRAETEGRIVGVPVGHGDRVAQGQELGRLALDGREAALTESQARVTQREIEYEAALELSGRGFRSEVEVAAARAQLDTAYAAVDRARLDIARTRLRAPIDGIVEEGHLELGDFVSVGDLYCTIVDLDPILFVGSATERQVGLLRVGMVGRATTLDGRAVEGVVSYIAAVAEPQTRTYRFELEVANPGAAIRDGLTAGIEIPVRDVMAHFVSPAVLTLADDGVIGVKTVDTQRRVAFHPVRIVRDTPRGLWLTGIPDGALLITVGQEFVVAGETVEPVEAPSPIAVGSPS